MGKLVKMTNEELDKRAAELQIQALEAENARLRAALEQIASRNLIAGHDVAGQIAKQALGEDE